MNDRGFLSQDEINTYRLIQAMDGPNPEIEQILQNDKAMRCAWKQVLAVAPPDPAPLALRPTLPPSEKLPAASEAVEPSRSAPAMAPATARPMAMAVPESDSVNAAIRSINSRTSRDLRDVLGKILGALHPHAVTKKPHEEVRKWIYAINAILTDRDEIMPCARPQPRLGAWVRDMTDTQAAMLNDKQMFDLQYAHKHGLGKPKKKWEPLLRSAVFDPVLAATFVTTVGSADKKIDALGLPEHDQKELAAIRSDKVRKQWGRLITEADCLYDHLGAAIRTGGSRIAESDTELWREDFIALKMANGRPAPAARLLVRLFGRSRPANQLSNRKRDLATRGFPVD